MFKIEKVNNNIKVDLMNGYIDEIVFSQQSDNNIREITLSLFNYTVPYDITGTTAVCTIKRSDNTIIVKDIDNSYINENNIKILLTGDDLKCSGDIKITVSILKGNITLSLPVLTVRIPKPSYNKQYVENSNEYHSFLDALSNNIEQIKTSKEVTDECIAVTNDCNRTIENGNNTITECVNATEESIRVTTESEEVKNSCLEATNNALTESVYAKEQGDYAKQEADRVAGMDVSEIIKEVDVLKDKSNDHTSEISYILSDITTLTNRKLTNYEYVEKINIDNINETAFLEIRDGLGTMPPDYSHDNHFYIFNFFHIPDWKVQIFYDFFTDRTFKRRKHHGVWKPWQEYAYKNDIFLKKVTKNIDLNTINSSCHFNCFDCKNVPNGYREDNNHFYIMNYVHSADWKKQIIHDVRSIRTFERSLLGKRWTTWIEK